MHAYYIKNNLVVLIKIKKNSPFYRGVSHLLIPVDFTIKVFVFL